jgi:serine/threonine protein phosphatase 1
MPQTIPSQHPRTIAIGDIHGCSKALAVLLEALDPQPGDTVVTLGDYVDCGFDSKGVIDQLIALGDRCRLVPLQGNHEEMMLGAREGGAAFQFWINCGGSICLDSYGSTGRIELVPRDHFAFLESCQSYFETAQHVFLHANYKPDLPLAQQDRITLRWLSLRDYVPPKRHCSGRIAIVGHTPQPEILDLGYLKCIDTGCGNGGWLTALDADSGQIWQVSEWGEARNEQP